MSPELSSAYSQSVTAAPFDSISLNATDAEGLTNISVVNVSITIDNTKANVTAVVPANDTTQTGEFLINASVNDTLTKVFNATFRLIESNGAAVTDWLYAELNSGDIDQGYWNTTYDTTSIADGDYNITINATDFSGNQQLVNITQITIDNAAADSTAPNNSIIDPVQFANISGDLFINASVNESTAEGTVAFVNVTLYNNTGNATGLIIMTLGAGDTNQGYWNTTIDTTTILDGNYNISVNATDSNGNINISVVNVSITIDNTKANVTIVEPANETFGNGTMLINASVNDTTSKVETVWFRLTNADGSRISPNWESATISAGDIDQGYWNLTIDTMAIGYGQANITINATDFAGNQQVINISQIYINNTVFIGQTDDDNAVVTRNHTFINLSITNTTTIDAVGIEWNGTNITIWGDGLVGLWHFNNNTNDSSGNRNEGVSTGINCSTSIDGQFGTACDFNGSHSINVGSDPLLDNLGPVTIQFWMNSSSDDCAINAETLWWKNVNDGLACRETGAMAFTYEAGATDLRRTTDNNFIVQNAWHHITLTWDGTATATGIHIYKDGIEAGYQDTQNGDSLADDESNNLFLGGRNNEKFFNGTLDEYRIYNYVQTPEQINITYRSEIGKYFANISENSFTNYSYYGWFNQTDGNYSRTETRNITFQQVAAANTAPVVYNVTPATVTPVDGSYAAELNISFNVTDADGAATLDNSLARVNVTQFSGGVPFINRTNTTGNCIVQTSSFNGGKDRSYSCIVQIRYHDNATNWQINATISDTSGNVHGNYSQNATINSLSAFSFLSADIELSAGLGSNDNELTFIINNTGNFKFTKLNLTPYALNASLTDFYMLGGETDTNSRGTANFSFNTTTSTSGWGVGLVNATGINITETYDSNNEGISIHLSPAEGHDTDITFANRTLYIYIDLPNNKGLSSGVTYNSSATGDCCPSWSIIADQVES